MMKKLLIVLLTLALLLSFAACGAAPEEPVAEEPVAVEPEAEPEAEAETEAGINLSILYEADDSMINNYSMLAVNPDAAWVDADGNAVSDVSVNTAGADAFINWMLSDGAELAGAYGFEQYGEYLFYLKDGAPQGGEVAPATDETKVIRLSTTTSVNDSGLLQYLLPSFEADYGYTVEITSAGTGKAIANAKMGNADLILVHSKSQEEAFIADGFARIIEGQEAERLTYMYNYFVLCGPAEDPAGVAGAASVKDAFALIADGAYPFVSRGDSSGTHTKEISLWPEALAITVEQESVAAYTDWYNYSNAGMAACLTMANEIGGYILSDKATFLTFAANNGQM